jgi:hypothetical protein
MMHNLGDLVSPRLTAAGGLDYPLGPGRIGGYLFTGVGWSSQEVQIVPGLEPATSSVLLVPLGACLTYSLPLSVVTPYAGAGLMVELIRTRTDGEHTGLRERTDAAFGVIGLVGARRRLGPGSAFLQAGYLWSRLDNDDVVLLAGGLVLEAGFRLEL